MFWGLLDHAWSAREKYCLTFEKGNRKALLLGTLIALVGITSTGPANASVAYAEEEKQVQQPVGTHSFSIPPQSLASALRMFSKQTGMEFAYKTSAVAGHKSVGVSGNLTPQQALKQILKNSGLTSKHTGQSLIVVAQASTGTTLDTITVIGGQADDDSEGDTGTGPVDGYVAQKSSTASKTGAPIIEIPRTISVTSSDEISDQKVNNVSEVLRYIPGVNSEVFGVDDRNQNYLVRGFSANQFVDGLDRASLGASQDAYGLERVEVLKGPSSTLYGQGSEGGVVNLVSKRPTEKFFAEIEGNYGSFEQVGGKFDFGGPIADSKFFYRFTGVRREGQTQVDFVDDNRLFLAPALSWKPTSATTFTLLAKYQKDDGGDLAFTIPVTGGLLPTTGGRFVPTNFFGGETDFNEYESEQKSVTLEVEHEFSDTFSLYHKSRYSDSERDRKFATVFGLLGDFPLAVQAQVSANFPGLDSATTLMRLPNQRSEIQEAFSTDTTLVGKFGAGPAKLTTLLGVDYKENNRTDTRQTGESGPGPFGLLDSLIPIDIFNPVYGILIPSLGTTTDNASELQQTGFYMQAQAKLNEKLIVTVGGRFDWAESEGLNKITGVSTSQSDEDFTSQSGVTYLFDNGLAPYASYAESFNPQGGTSFFGQPFDPRLGVQKEVGIKYQPKGIDALITFSAFDLRLQNVLIEDPLHAGFRITDGEQTSRGVEIEVKANLFNKALQLSGGYSVFDLEITKSDDPINIGRTPTRRPEEFGSLWAIYTFQDGPLTGFGFGGGVRYVGRSFAKFDGTLEVPSYTLFDAVLQYETQGMLEGLLLALNATNLADETYINSCAADGRVPNCAYGHKRKITASATYRW